MKVYKTTNEYGSEVRFEYKDEKYAHVNIYVNDKYWGVPQGNIFIKALLKDIEKLKKDSYTKSLAEEIDEILNSEDNCNLIKEI